MARKQNKIQSFAPVSKKLGRIPETSKRLAYATLQRIGLGGKKSAAGRHHNKARALSKKSGAGVQNYRKAA